MLLFLTLTLTARPPSIFKMRTCNRLVLALACSTTALAAQCYFPNGNKVDSDTACNPNALVSACCYDNQACLSNGLCVSDPHDPAKARLHRGTCTDANWKSGNCPRQCLDIDNNGVPVYSCNSTSTDSYCCYDNCDCQANSGSEIFTFAQSPADVYTLTIIGESYTQTHTSTSSSSSVTASASSSETGASTTIESPGSSASNAGTSSTSTETPSDIAPAKKSNTTALGVGLGVGIPVAALVGVGIFFLLRRRRRNVDSPPSEMAADEYAEDGPPPSTKYAHTQETEVPTAPASAATNADVNVGAPAMHELDGQGAKPVELPVTMTTSAPSTAGARAVEMESPLSSPRETSNRGA